jgi:hypothetical protein
MSTMSVEADSDLYLLSQVMTINIKQLGFFIKLLTRSFTSSISASLPSLVTDAMMPSDGCSVQR